MELGSSPINRVLTIAPAQSSARVGAGNGLDGDRPFIEVDVAAGLILVGVLDVVLWPGEQDFVVPPNVLDVVGELAHQNIESVRVLDPRPRCIRRLFYWSWNTKRATAQSARALSIFHHSGRACCVCFLKAAGPLLFFRRRVAFDVHVFPFKQELHHLLLKQFAVLRVHHAELFLVDQHGLLVLPLRPRLLWRFRCKYAFRARPDTAGNPRPSASRCRKVQKMVLLIINPL